MLGGGERYPLELARALAGRVDCELVTFGPAPGVRREPGGLQVRVLKRDGLLGGHPAQPWGPGLAEALAGADIVHTHHSRSAPSVVAAVSGRARRAAVVTTDHGFGGGRWDGLLTSLFDRFLTVSRYSAATLGAPPERVLPIYGGADAVRFSPGPDGARDGVVFVGRLTPHKGVDRLIDALPAGVRLRIAGTGGHDPAPPESDYPHLLARKAAGRAVELLGAVAEADLPQLYRSARVAVLPSVHETCYGRSVEISELLGLSVIEAMASATPVVCSRLGGLPEVVVDGETGFLVEPGDVAALGDRIRTLVADPVLAERMGRAAREVVLERFTWEACASRCLAAYGELLGGDPSAAASSAAW